MKMFGDELISTSKFHLNSYVSLIFIFILSARFFFPLTLPCDKFLCLCIYLLVYFPYCVYLPIYLLFLLFLIYKERRKKIKEKIQQLTESQKQKQKQIISCSYSFFLIHKKKRRARKITAKSATDRITGTKKTKTNIPIEIECHAIKYQTAGILYANLAIIALVLC